MAVEEISRLRTIAIVGQGGAGKTQLAEAMLYTAGATKVLGRPDDARAALVRARAALASDKDKTAIVEEAAQSAGLNP